MGQIEVLRPLEKLTTTKVAHSNAPLIPIESLAFYMERGDMQLLLISGMMIIKKLVTLNIQPKGSLPSNLGTFCLM